MMAKEALKTYITRTKKAMNDIPEEKITRRDKERLEKKLKETEDWVAKKAFNAQKEDFEVMQKELESAMNAIMLRINQSTSDFWEADVSLPHGESFIEQGGFFLDTGC